MSKETRLQEIPGAEHYIDPGWLNSSGIMEYERCPRAYFFSQGLGLELDIEQGPGGPLEWGGAMHRAFPHAYDGDLQKAVEAFDAEWDDFVQSDGKKHTRDNAVGILAGFMGDRAGGKALYEIISEEEVASWEVPQPHDTYFASSSAPIAKYELGFSVDIGMDVPLVGKIDAPCRMKYDNSLWVLDFKTTSGISTNLEYAFQLYVPAFVYSVGLQEITGTPVHGVVFDMVLKAKIKRETMSFMTPLEQWELEEFKEYAREVRRSIKVCELTGHWPKNLSGCAAYSSWGVSFGSCVYQRLCKCPDWTEMLSLYRESDFHREVRLTIEGNPLED
jgi:hypothetical protein